MAEKSSNRFWAGFDLGGTKMMAVVFDGQFRARGRKRRKTKPQGSPDADIRRILETVEFALQDAHVTREQLAGIGLGVPGPLDLDKGILLESPNLGWKNVPLKKEIEKKLGCPAFILNDVDAGTYGEYQLGTARGAHCAVGIFPGTGIGGGCVYDGRLLRGKTGSCFEIGHCRVLPDGPLCGCGQRGCLETVASRLAVSREAAAAAFRGQAPHLLAAHGTDLADIRSNALADAIKAGDKIVEAIVRRAAHWLGIGISLAVNLLSPDIIVLGGGLVEAMPDLMLSEVESAARRHAMESLRHSFKIAAAALGDDAVAAGAAAFADSILAENKPAP